MMTRKNKTLRAMSDVYGDVVAHVAVIRDHTTYLGSAVVAGDVARAEHQIAEIKRRARAVVEECTPPGGDWTAV